VGYSGTSFQLHAPQIFQDSLPQALALADRVALGGVFRAQQLGDENRLDPETVAGSVRALGKEANVISGGEAMAEFLAVNAKPNDLLLIMSNGSFDGLCEKLLAKLTAAQPVPAGANPR
jgi:UDP-N-acetylmuramate: L-alanyl-gamma-D-glutamyl-meso-diaminopimelate ligase